MGVGGHAADRVKGRTMLVSGDFRGWDADAEAVPLDRIDTMWLSLLGLFPLAAAAELLLQLAGLR